MPRLLFKKTDTAVWMSHLDLMRLFQRAFKRAGLHLTHTHGFNPRPSVSLALPLSVGTQSICELLDFELNDENIDNTDIRNRLNSALVQGVEVLDVYDGGKKIKELTYLHCEITLEYDSGVPSGATEAIQALFARPELLVVKKSKNGPKEQNIIPMIQNICVKQTGDRSLILNAIICCQNPTLNPAQLFQPICEMIPEFAPNHATYLRVEVYDKNNEVFR